MELFVGLGLCDAALLWTLSLEDCCRGYLCFAEESVAARSDLSSMVLFVWVVTQSPFILFIPLPFMLLPGFLPPSYMLDGIYIPLNASQLFQCTSGTCCSPTSKQHRFASPFDNFCCWLLTLHKLNILTGNQYYREFKQSNLAKTLIGNQQSSSAQIN